MDLGYKRLRFDVSEYIGVGVSLLNTIESQHDTLFKAR